MTAKSSASEPTALGVIILGAGASSRMGRPKLLLPWGNTSIVGHLIQQWSDLQAVQIAIVHRPADKPLAAELDRLNFPAQNRIENPNPERGMFSSIVCAANWTGWNDGLNTWTIVLGDQPQIKPGTLRDLLAFHREHADAVCQPSYEGRGRHPVLLPRRAFEELKSSRDETLKDFLKPVSRQSVLCPVNDSGLMLDLDTPEDYHRTISFHPGST